MMLDASGQFSNAQVITTSAASSVYDMALGTMLTGSTYTNPPGTIIGNATVFGEDLGIGQGVGTPRIVVSTGPAAFTGGTSLQIQVQGAVDNSSGNLAGLSWTTYEQTDVMATALLTANTRLASLDLPVRKVGQALPRFIRLNYAVVGTFNAGSLNADVTLSPDDATGTLGLYPANYVTAA